MRPWQLTAALIVWYTVCNGTGAFWTITTVYERGYYMEKAEMEQGGYSYMIYGVIILLLASADLVLKQLVERQEPERFPRPLEGTNGKILLYQNHNPGFPFGLFKKYGELVRMLPLAVTSALAGALAALAAGKEHIVRKLALATVIGGSLSNLYDRFVRRYVVDYFSVQIGPLKKVVFNLGDICVFLGSVVLILAELVREIRDNRRSDRKKM